MLEDGVAAFGGVNGIGALTELAPLVERLKYFRNISGETTASCGEDSPGVLGTPLSAGGADEADMEFAAAVALVRDAFTFST